MNCMVESKWCEQKEERHESKLKFASQELIQMWKEHFKILLENSAKVTDKPIKKLPTRHQTRTVYKGRT